MILGWHGWPIFFLLREPTLCRSTRTPSRTPEPKVKIWKVPRNSIWRTSENYQPNHEFSEEITFATAHCRCSHSTSFTNLPNGSEQECPRPSRLATAI